VLHGESRSTQVEGPGRGRVPTRARAQGPLLCRTQRYISCALPTWCGTRVAWCYTAKAVPLRRQVTAAGVARPLTGLMPPPLQDSRYTHFPGYPPMVGVRCHNRTCGRMSPVTEASRARNVAMPWPPRIQSVQVQGFKMQKVMRSIHRFGQLTWSSPGGGPRARATGPDREHGGSRGRGTMPRIARKPARPLEGVSSPQLHCLGQSFTPLVTRLIGGILGVAVMRG
jgi:hypothetical protein